MSAPSGKFSLRLPATSANLGPGFDTVAVALDFALHVEAEPGLEFSIDASGRDADRCSRLEGNLVLDLYSSTLETSGRTVVPLAMRMCNEIPLGMGCGSSAAGRLAALAMAVHFGRLDWPGDQILTVASALEGHPDNAAACWLGGFVAAGTESGAVRVARVEPPKAWRALVMLPTEPLATSEARALLPASYSREDVVRNLQAVSLLGLAFSQGRGDLLRTAMNDRIHQPYRASMCPLLPRLTPLAGTAGILGVALSGAGPAVLAIVADEDSVPAATEAILSAVSDLSRPEVIVCRFGTSGAGECFASSGVS
jgi:homoserine kinase